jgi:hypothetical protein
MTIGAVIAPTNNDLPLNRPNRVMIMAAMVPIITAMVADKQAIFRLVIVARKIIGSENSALYHLRENPVHTLTKRDSLNE